MLRNAFATHLLQANCNIRTVQELLSEADLLPTMICTQGPNRGGRAWKLTPSAVGLCCPLI